MTAPHPTEQIGIRAGCLSQVMFHDSKLQVAQQAQAAREAAEAARLAEDKAGVGAQGCAEGIVQVGQPAPDVAGEGSQDVLARASVHQAVEDTAPVDAEQVGQEAADLVDAGAQGGAQAHDPVALP